MQFIAVLALLSITLFSSVQADTTQYIGELPSCGLQCLLEVVPQYCSLTNSTCICTNPAFSSATNLCVSQNCTVIESLQVANISIISCNVETVSRQNHLIATIALEIMALIAVCLRLFSQWKLERSFKIDDWIMVAVACLVVPFAALRALAAVYGFGLNIWDIEPKDIVLALKFFFWDEVIYLLILGLSKISILMFYLRVFPSQNFRRMCYTLLGFILICTTLFPLIALFQCIPISYNWRGWMENFGKHKCSDLNAIAYATSTINIVQGFMVLFLPLPWLVRLKIGIKRKANVLFMFSVGIFICVVSIIRLVTITKFKATTNPTWDYVDTIFWTSIEVNVSIIVPSLPVIRTFLSHYFPKLFALNTQNGSNGSYEQSQPPSFNNSCSFKPFSTSSKLFSKQTTVIGRDVIDRDSADFFTNSRLKLGDKTKGAVYTDVEAGRRSSDLELVAVRDDGIVVLTETRLEESARVRNSQGSWYDSMSRSVTHGSKNEGKKAGDYV